MTAQPGFTPFAPHDIEQSLVSRFEEQVDRHATRTALGWDGTSLSYAGLDALANRIAHAIRARVMRPQQPVVLLLDQGPMVVAAILGVLKSHQIYVPLDPDLPTTSLGRLIQHLKPALAITLSTVVRPGAADALSDVQCLDLTTLPADLPDTRLGALAGPDSLAYVFHTSGSTGQPKGVFDCHRNVLHNILRYTNSLRLAASDRLTLLQAPWFSGAVSSLFGALLNGAAVHPYDVRRGLGSPLGTWLEANRLTVYHSVPVIFRTLDLDGFAFADVRVIRLEGDLATPVDVAVFRRRFASATLVNGLGATETGLTRQFFLRSDQSISHATVPVGHATTGTDAQIVDEAGHVLGAGEVGEVVIRSPYLALGYWRDPGRTDTAFSLDHEKAGWRRYRTGDLGRIDPDGCLEYLGRRDALEKIHGHRIDGVEIESRIMRLPGVRDAAVATKTSSSGETRLVAYVVPALEADISGQHIRDMLARDLPVVAIPSKVIFLEELPRGANGKIDRGSLPDPGRTRPREAPPPVPPLDELEQCLVEIWQRILDTEPVGRFDNFFDLGGDSLTAAQMFVDLEAATGLTVPFAILIERPTLSALADALRAAPELGRPLLAALQPHGSRPPLFLVHPHDGQVLLYAQLARRLGNDQPVYGLQATVETSGRPALRSIEHMAARYVEVVRQLQPSGPYRFGGRCYGAVVALEMARQLRLAGEAIALLALLDPSPADFATIVPREACDRYRACRRAGAARVREAELAARSPMARLGYRRYEMTQWLRTRFIEAAWHAVRPIADALDRPMPASLRSLERRQWHALSLYTIRRDEGAATLFLPMPATASYTENPTATWASVAHRVNVHLVHADERLGMLREPAVTALAQDLATCLSACADTSIPIRSPPKISV